MTNEEVIWKKLMGYGLAEVVVAGIMGNLKAESGLNPKNLQDTSNRSLGLSDDEYTRMVDSGTYSNFVKDSAGYGLAQWTYWSRKQALLNYAKSTGKSIGDLEMQVEFLVKEIKENYLSVFNALLSATSVQTASNVVLLQYERPADASLTVQNYRASLGQAFYNKYHNQTEETKDKVVSLTTINIPTGGGSVMFDRQKVIDIALNEVGYLEKANNSQLDDKTANAGSGNWTKYSRDLDGIYGFYNGGKNGYPWCDCFCDWCFVQAYGVDAAKQLLCQPNSSYGAGCKYSAQYYKNKGQFYTSNPQAGDQIFFYSGGEIGHTGLVYQVDGTKVYTVEGNTSSASGVVANGGAVEKKAYTIGSSKIAGYGRPKYDDISVAPNSQVVNTPASSVNMNITTIKRFQSWLNQKYSAGLDVDGSYGPITKKSAIKAFQTYLNKTYNTKLELDASFGPLTKSAAKKCNILRSSKGDAVYILQGILYGIGIDCGGFDGSFGIKLDSAVRSYQRSNGLEVDGICGSNTWGSLFAK